MKKIVTLFFSFLLIATPAYAGPIAAAISAIAGAIGVSAATVALVVINFTVSAVMGYLQKRKMKDQPQPGIQTERKKTGGVNSRAIIVGTYATAGSEVCPPMSQGVVNKTPNSYLTYVIALADNPVNGLSGIIVNGERVAIGAVAEEYGLPLQGKYLNRAWIRFHDGNQVAADTLLMSKFASYPDRPWNANMIGKGMSYAIVTCLYDRELYKGEPDFRFEIQGSRMYDVRKDTTAGGSGSHRWGNLATYEFSDNVMVIIYNLLRGMTMFDGSFYGGTCSADDLPFSNWVAAMNVCDELVTLQGGGTEKRYRTGFEILTAERDPADIIEELLKCCSGDIVESGGVYKVRAGGPGLPVMFITDKDLIVTKEQDYRPIQQINGAFNQITHVFPAPAENWNQHEGPSISFPEYLTADKGIPLVKNISFPASPFALQNQRLCRAWLIENRRNRIHSQHMVTPCFALEPMDVISWTSTINGYVNKSFEIEEVTENYRSLINGNVIREVDPADYNWSAGFTLPDTFVAPVWRLPDVQVVNDFTLSALTVVGTGGTARRPAVRVSWPADVAIDATGVQIKYRVNGQTQEIVTPILPVKNAYYDEFNIIANTAYQFTFKVVANRATEWAAWKAITSPNILIGPSDLAQTVYDEIENIASENGITTVSTLPPAGDRPNQIVNLLPPGRLYRWDATTSAWTTTIFAGIEDGSVSITKLASNIEAPLVFTGAIPGTRQASDLLYRTDDGKLYRWNGTAYIATVATTDLTGTVVASQIADAAITVAKFAAGLRPVEVLAALPGTPHIAGRQVFLTTDSKLYRNTGSGWTAAVAAADMSGQITSTQISDSAITTPKLAAGSVTANAIAALAVTAAALAADSVTAGKIAAAAINTRELAVGAVRAENIFVGNPNNLIPNGNFDDGDNARIGNFWANPPSNGGNIEYLSKATNPNYTETGAFSLLLQKPAGNLTVQTATSNRTVRDIPIEGGVSYYLETSIRTNGTPTAVGAYVQFHWLAQDKASISVTQLVNNGPMTTAWVKYSNTVIAPADACYLRLAVINHSTQITTQNLFVDRIICKKADGASLTVDGGITAVKLAAGSVTANAIAALAVTAAALAADSVTAGKIAAAAISARELAVGSVLASKIAIGDATNYYPDPAYNDPGMLIIQNSAAPSTIVAETTAGLNGRALNLVPADLSLFADVYTQSFACEPSTEYLFKGYTWYTTGTPPAHQIFVQFFSLNNGAITYLSQFGLINVTPTTTPVATETPFTTPAGAVMFRLLYRRVGGGTSPNARFGGVSIRKKSPGSLIVDGAITALKLAVGAVTADAIAAGAIIASKIAAGAVAADKLDTVSLGVAGVSIFGGTLKSSNYSAGVSGWQLTHDGNAEVNNLQVREDMLVNGAVSRQGLLPSSAAYNLTVTTTTPVQVSGTFQANFAGYRGSLLYPDNPVLVTLTCDIATASGAGIPCYFDIEYRNIGGSTWASCATVILRADTVVKSVTGRSLMTTPWAGIPISGLKEYRLVALRANSSLPNFTISQILCTLEQINK